MTATRQAPRSPLVRYFCQRLERTVARHEPLVVGTMSYSSLGANIRLLRERDGLSEKQIRWLIDAYMAQPSAWNPAIHPWRDFASGGQLTRSRNRSKYRDDLSTESVRQYTVLRGSVQQVRVAQAPSWDLNAPNLSPTVRDECAALLARASTGSKPVGRGLMLFGLPGRGKSTLAASIMAAFLQAENVLASAVPTGLAISSPDLIEAHRLNTGGKEGGEIWQQVTGLICGTAAKQARTRLLCLEDVGDERPGPSDFSRFSIDYLLRTRYDLAAPTIITTRVPPEHWSDVYGPSLGSFVREAFVLLEVGGDDLRSSALCT